MKDFYLITNVSQEEFFLSILLKKNRHYNLFFQLNPQFFVKIGNLPSKKFFKVRIVLKNFDFNNRCTNENTDNFKKYAINSASEFPKKSTLICTGTNRQRGS